MDDVFLQQTSEVSKEASIGKGTMIWHHAQVREGAVIGERCNIGKNAYIDKGVTIGSNSKIQNNASVYNVSIGENVLIGPGAIITNDLYPRAAIWDDAKRTHTIIEDGASVGANSTVIGGVRIGKHAMIGAGSVVTKDVPAHALAFGNPARVQGNVCRCGRPVKDAPYICDDCKAKARL